MSGGRQPATVTVAVDAPLLENLTYLQNSDVPVQRGDIVNVSLGKRNVKGFVIQDHWAALNNQSESKFKLKEILSLDTEWPRLKDPFLKWLEWVAEYYIHPLGQVIQLSFPPLRKTTQKRKSNRAPVVPILEKTKKPNLTAEQKKCVDAISVNSQFAVHLVHGVTGSGKTEIYLQLFEKCIRENKKGLFLVPEISLTPQLVNRFVERFGDQVAVLHSQLTDRERTNQWWEIIEGEKKILIGARSALFCPVQNLGLVVVDEEHESSFKQDEKLKYHGRDCAVMLGKFSNCPVILGSATPSLESWKNAQEKKYVLHSLLSRVADRPLPEIEIIDLRAEKENQKRPQNLPFWLSDSLYKKMLLALEKKEQIALLLNRRGMANMVFCQGCGYSAECPNCDISLTLHARSHLVCHYCDYHQNFTLKCPQCSCGELTALGLGTELIETDLKKLFPELEIARADRDEIQSRLEMENLIADMENEKINILVGTQMIAKGLDFPKLNLVGLVLADVGFNLPDFRATEKSFQLITQMSGRSGRHVSSLGTSGQVIVQTYNPDHESLIFAKNHDYLGFVNNELQARSPLSYPPFQKMISFRIQSMSLESAQETIQLIKARAISLQQKFSEHYKDIQILGPAAAPLAKIKNNFRFHMIIKGEKSLVLNTFSRRLLADQKWVPSKVKVIVDVDPISLL